MADEAFKKNLEDKYDQIATMLLEAIAKNETVAAEENPEADSESPKKIDGAM